MESKILHSGPEARAKIYAGICTLTDHVSETLGPKGRTILIQDAAGNPMVTKDGVTVAQEIELDDPVENMGVRLVREAATRTNDGVGDGTTTSTILAQRMMQEANKTAFEGGVNPFEVRRGMEMAKDAMIEEIKKMAVLVEKKEDYAAVATISSQDASIGELVADVIDAVGDDGIVTIEDAKGVETTMQVVEGMKFDAGYKSAYFVNTEWQTAELENCRVLVTDARVTSINQIVEALNGAIKEGSKNLLIVADDIEGEALNMLVLNKMKGVANCVAVRAPSFGTDRTETLKDIAVVTGANFSSEEVGLPVEKVRITDLGKAKKVIVTPNSTTIIDGAGDKHELRNRVGETKAFISASESDHDRELAHRRIARMTGGIGVLSVGGMTEVEQREKRHRIEDALSAAKAAAVAGIVPGGGTALVRAANAAEGMVTSPGEKIGFDMVLKAATKPMRMICINAGVPIIDGVREIIDRCRCDESGRMVYDAMRGEFVDGFERGIIDPALVVIEALNNAVSVASVYVTLAGTIVNKPLEAQEKFVNLMQGSNPARHG